MRIAVVAAVFAAAAGIAALAVHRAHPRAQPSTHFSLGARWAVASAREDWARRPVDVAALAAAGDACSVSRVPGDFDGDGRADIALVYAAPRRERCASEGVQARFRVALLLASGARIEQALNPPLVEPDSGTGSACSDSCSAFDAPDLNRDGRDELAIELWHGASQVGIGIFTLDGGVVRRAAVRGRPLDLRMYGSICCGADVACRAPDLVVQGAYGLDGRTFHTGETVYRFDGRNFALLRRTHRSAPASEGPPRLRGRRCLVESGKDG